jgi:hypothetical protein
MALSPSSLARRMKRLPLISLALAALVAGQSIACACTLQKIAIGPLAAENGDTYAGRAADVEVRFHNDVQDRAVTVFPEPPMTLRHLRAASECAVDEGGVWGRDGVWLTADGNTLVTTESSGSYEGLVFHDTRSCAKVGEIDVSGTPWRVDGAAIVLDHAITPHGTRRVRLDAACRPAGIRRR